MHLPLRRNTRRGSSPPKAAPSPPETSGTSGTQKQQHESLPHNATPSTQSTSPQSSPQKLKSLGRRMTSFSKPVRMLKSIASRSSLRNQNGSAHGRRPSAVSVHSAASQQEAEHEREHEPNVKEQRESIDTDYGKEITSRSGEEKKSVRSEGEGQQAVVEPAVVPHEDAVKVENVKVEHEAAVRQEEPQAGLVEEKEQVPELRARVEEASNEAATPVAVFETAIATAPVFADGDAKADVKKVGSHAEKTSHDPKEATPEDLPIAASAPAPVRDTAVEVEPAPADSVVIVPSQNAETISLSSSSTTVDPPAPLSADNNNVKANGDVPEAKIVTVQVKMEQESEPAKNEGEDVNPFLVDDPEDPLSEPESQKGQEGSPAVRSDAGTPVAQSVALSKEFESTDKAASPAPSAHVVEENKTTVYPPPPAKTTAAPTESSSSPKSASSEDEAPELHAPALTVTSLFLPVPQTDPLSTLLTKYVPEPHLRPPRDTSGEWQHTDFHTLVMTNNWRALARMARDRIVVANPRDVELVLNLWYIRLSSLARLRLFNQTSAECENLFSVLATIEPPVARAYILRNVLPFELEVLRARCAYWAGDHLGYLDDLSALLHRCRVRARQARDLAERAMWKERGARMALIVASQLVEMKDYTAATTLLEPLTHSSPSSSPSPALQSAIARIYLQAGNLRAAQDLFTLVDSEPNAEPALKIMNAVVQNAALGDWGACEENARRLVESKNGVGDVLAANNYAVALLGQGRIKEGIEILEATLQASPSLTTTTEPFLFNLSTMYELRAGLTIHRKRDLLIEVAKWSGDGLRTACLKLNA